VTIVEGRVEEKRKVIGKESITKNTRGERESIQRRFAVGEATR